MALVEEGWCLQKQLMKKAPGGHFKGEEDPARTFASLMATGRVHQALNMLTETPYKFLLHPTLSSEPI